MLSEPLGIGRIYIEGVWLLAKRLVLRTYYLVKLVDETNSQELGIRGDIAGVMGLAKLIGT